MEVEVEEGDAEEEVVVVGESREVQGHQVGRRVERWNIEGFMELHNDAGLTRHEQRSSTILIFSTPKAF